MDWMKFLVGTIIITGLSVAIVGAITYSCDPWDAEIRAQKWADGLGLRGAVVECHMHGDNCRAECDIAYEGGKDRLVISAVCVAKDALGNRSGHCWKD